MRRVPLFALLLGGLASAQQTVVPTRPSEPEIPPPGVLIELKLGFWKPRVGDERGLAFNPYTEIFGDSSMLYYGGEIDYLAWRGYGSVGVGFSVGYAEKYAPALVAGTGAPSSEKTALIVFPLRLSAIYRFDITWTRWRFPLVPYAKLALLATPFRVTKGGDTETYTNPVTGQTTTGKGLRWGYGFTVGVAFVLDVLSPQMAKDLRTDTGIRHSYLFGEFNADVADDFGKNVLNLSARWFTFGLGFEF
jgi:hypothetical protein